MLCKEFFIFEYKNYARNIMINIEFETFEEIEEILNIVGDTINTSLNKNEKQVTLNIKDKQYFINTESDVFKAGLLYGLSISKDIAIEK